MADKSNEEYNTKNNELFRKRITLQTERNDLAAEQDQLNSKPLTPEDAARLRVVVRRLSQLEYIIDDITGEICVLNAGLVHKYVQIFTKNASASAVEDFIGAGTVGLMYAIDSYDPTKGKFAGWAYKPIQRQVLRAVRDSDHPNMNPGDFEKRPDVLRAQTELRAEAGDDEGQIPFEEIALRAGVTLEQVQRVLDAPQLSSLATPISDEGEATLGDIIESNDLDIADAVLEKLQVGALAMFGINNLDEREKFVISRRYGLDREPVQRLAAIGEVLNLSREAVRQIEAKGVAKMQHPVVLRSIVRHGR